MNIRDSMKQNLIDLASHLQETAALDVSQLGSEWEARREALRRDALYLTTFVIDDVPEPQTVQKIATFVPPERSVAMTSEDSSASVPFLASGNGARP